MTLSRFLEERLFAPLPMTDSAFHVPPDPSDLIDASPPRNDSGGAGAVSTAADYQRFVQMLLNGGWRLSFLCARRSRDR